MMLTEDGASVTFCSYFEAPKIDGISWKRSISSPIRPVSMMFDRSAEKEEDQQRKTAIKTKNELKNIILNFIARTLTAVSEKRWMDFVAEEALII
jgi:hypothetical protein